MQGVDRSRIFKTYVKRIQGIFWLDWKNIEGADWSGENCLLYNIKCFHWGICHYFYLLTFPSMPFFFHIFSDHEHFSFTDTERDINFKRVFKTHWNQSATCKFRFNLTFTGEPSKFYVWEFLDLAILHSLMNLLKVEIPGIHDPPEVLI